MAALQDAARVSQRLVEVAIPAIARAPWTAYKDAVLALSPLGYWRCISLTSTETDLGSGAHNGTWQNSPTLGQAGPTRDFDTASALMTAASNHSLKIVGNVYALGDGPFSIGCWYKPTGVVNTQQIFAESGTNGSPSITLGQTDGTFRVQGRSTSIVADTVTVQTAGPWFFVVWTRSSGGTTNHVYINGVDDIGSVTSTTIVSPGSGDTFWGVNASGTGSGVNGNIAELFLTSSELSSANIVNLYNIGKSGPLGAAITQRVTEVAIADSGTDGHLSQRVVEVAVANSEARGRVSQDLVEVAIPTTVPF